MRAKSLFFFLGVVACCALPALAQRQGISQSRKSNDKGCAIAGTVTSATTHRPIAGAWVSLSERGPIQLYQVFTDALGRFEIRNVKSPDSLAVGMNGYVLWGMGLRGCPERPGAPVYHRPIRLMPAGVISGRVTDRNGRPLLGAVVRVVRMLYGETDRMIRRATPQRFTTDDRGDYRVFGLAPGRYLVVVNYEPGFAYPNLPSWSPQITGVFRQLTYPHNFFYPGTTRISQAKPILISPGRHVSAIDFRLVARRTYQVSGTISGLPVSKHPPFYQPNLHLRVCDSGHVLWPWPAPPHPSVGRDGKFVVRGVLPGCYELQARQPMGGAKWKVGKLRLEVSNHDIRGLRLTLQQPLKIPLQVAFDGVPASRYVWVLLQARDGETFGVSRTEEGSKLLKRVPPGSYTIFVRPDSLPEGAYLKSARLGSRNILGHLVRIFPDRPAGVLKVVIAGDGAELSGTVTGSTGKLEMNASIVLVPAPPLRHVRCLYRMAVSNPSGGFLLRGIRPGAYTLYAWEGIQYPNHLWFNPLFMRGMKGHGIPIRFAPGQHQTLNLHAISVFPSGAGKP